MLALLAHGPRIAVLVDGGEHQPRAVGRRHAGRDPRDASIEPADRLDGGMEGVEDGGQPGRVRPVQRARPAIAQRAGMARLVGHAVHEQVAHARLPQRGQPVRKRIAPVAGRVHQRQRSVAAAEVVGQRGKPARPHGVEPVGGDQAAERRRRQREQRGPTAHRRRREVLLVGSELGDDVEPLWSIRSAWLVRIAHGVGLRLTTSACRPAARAG